MIHAERLRLNHRPPGPDPGGKENPMRKRITAILPLLLFLIGLSLLLYPTVSNYINQKNATRAIVGYDRQVSDMDSEENRRLRTQAQEYNQALLSREYRFLLTEEQWAEYEGTLDVTGTGIMGYLDIPQLGVSLPIYHGTDEGVLQIGVGHIEGSSLPVGGESTHAVLSGHRGLPSARLLTDLDRMKVGDLFYLHVLGDTLAYEVDQIVTVLPDELEELAIQEGEDLCTLVTCTPYGVNSHRLLVRGHRVAMPEPNVGSGTAAAVEEHNNALPIPLLIIGAVVLTTAAAGWYQVRFRPKGKRKKPGK